MPQAGVIEIGIDVNLNDAKKNIEYTEAMLKRVQNISMATSTAINAVKYSALSGLGAFALMAGPAVLASKALDDFDDNLRRIGAIGGPEFVSSMESMTKTINELSVKFGSTAKDITEVIITYAKAGFDYNETMKMLEPTLQLAIANQTELAKASELAMYAFTLWGREAGMDVYEMLNKMHLAANLSILDIEDLEHAFSMAGSAASIANISYEEFLALAGGLSMVAAEAGSNVGSLITNILVRGDELERILGHYGIIENGTLSINALLDAMEDASITEEQWAEAFAVWGVRSAKPLMQIRNAATEIETIYNQLIGSQDELASGSEYMSQSFERLWSSLIQSIMTGLRTTESMDAIRESMQALNKELSSSQFGEALGRMMIMSSNFIVDNADTMIAALENLVNVLIKLYPSIYSIGEMFIDVAKFVSAVPSEILKFVAMLGIMNKIVPVTTIILPNLGKEFLRLTDNLNLATIKALSFEKTMSTMLSNFGTLLLGIGMLTTGIFLATTATSNLDKAVAALTITLGALIPVLWTLNLLQVALTPAKVIKSLAAVGALAAGLTFYLSSGNKETSAYGVANAPYNTTNTSNVNNITYYNNFYGVDNNEIKSIDMLGVRSY